jgi:hexosaminidase
MQKILALIPLAAFAACQSTSITPALNPMSLVPQPLLVEVVERQPDAIVDRPVHFVNLEAADFALTEAWPQAEDGFPIVFRGGFSPEDFHGGQGAEGAYSLDVYADSIVVRTESDAGRYSSLATLMQLVPVEHWPVEKGGALKLGFEMAPVHIEDQPRYAYRGMHLDVCRHFMPIEFIEKYIDNLALHKFNRFHWHLTEDQGWRIEIKKYPKLTEVGAWRSASQTGAYSEQRFDSTRHGGFYTQEEARHIVDYAAKRGITVIPEIEMPGHSLAALAAYPELSCTGGPFEVAHGWGVFDDVYCAGNPEVYTFLEGVLDEIMDIFPSPIVHIGGDECPKTRWETCSKCQQEMAGNYLKDEHELQSHFITRMERYLNTHGRNIIGWDEILEGGLAPNAAVMSWRGVAGGIQAASMEHNVVMTPGKPLYFDHYQFNPEGEPVAIGGFNALADVYAFNPVEGVPAEFRAYIMGAQANVWTEYMETSNHVEHMVQPRASALSEVLWLGEKRPGEDAAFRKAMDYHVQRLKAMGWNYAPYEFEKAGDEAQ